MSDLTREEVRRACEDAGWEWCGHDGGYNPDTADHYFRFGMEHLWRDDAIALLEATGEPIDFSYTPGKHGNDWWAVQIRFEQDPDGYAHSLGSGQAPDLPTAAVKAVNKWKGNNP